MKTVEELRAVCAAREIAVSLPEREYELAGRLMAEAIAAAGRDGVPIREALSTVVAEHGRTLGRAALAAAHDTTAGALGIACSALADLVCHMNLALVEGLVDEIGAGDLDARLDPADGRCCVTLAERTP